MMFQFSIMKYREHAAIDCYFYPIFQRWILKLFWSLEFGIWSFST
jgi:hypothetical protein